MMSLTKKLSCANFLKRSKFGQMLHVRSFRTFDFNHRPFQEKNFRRFFGTFLYYRQFFSPGKVSDLCEETFSHEHHRTRQRWNFDIVTDKPVEKCAYPTLDYLPEQLPFENAYFCRPSRSSDIRNSSCWSSSANSTEGASSWDDYDVSKDVIANSDSNKSDTNS